jgi:DNA-binding NarL/FixJ family response regulator
MDQITVLIADDHALFREGLGVILSQQGDIRVVGEAKDGFEALSRVEALQPDILLLDVLMPGLGGLEILPKIRSKSPKTKVLMLTGFFEEELITEAMQNGAKGYLLKTANHAELIKAIRATHSGELWAERRVLTLLLENLFQRVSDLQVPLSNHRGNLTDREQEIVEWVIQGMTNKEIAGQLGISDKTVKTHLSNIFSKLKVSRRLELLLYRIADRSA